MLLKTDAVKGILYIRVSKKIFPYFLNFSSIWIRFTTGDIHKNLWDCEFPENLQWKQNFPNMCQWIHICTLQVNCLMWVKCSIRNVNIIVLSICEFHKIQHNDGQAFLMGVHKITFTFHVNSCFCNSHKPPPLHLHSSNGWRMATVHT